MKPRRDSCFVLEVCDRSFEFDMPVTFDILQNMKFT